MLKTASEIADSVLVKLSAMSKEAGYFQNIVGFDDLNKFKEQRAAMLEAEKGEWETDPIRTKNYEDLIGSFQSNIGGKEMGYWDKNDGVPSMHGVSALEDLSGESTGEGYIARADILKRLENKGLPTPQGTRDAIMASKHPYFTSTEAG